MGDLPRLEFSGELRCFATAVNNFAKDSTTVCLLRMYEIAILRRASAATASTAPLYRLHNHVIPSRLCRIHISGYKHMNNTSAFGDDFRSKSHYISVKCAYTIVSSK